MSTKDQQTQSSPTTMPRAAGASMEPHSRAVAAHRAPEKHDTTHVPLSGLYQIAFVTTDLDRAMQLFAETYGISKFRIKRDIPSAPGMPKMSAHVAHAYVGPMMIELIQPVGGDDSLYREILPPDGFGIRLHHFGFIVRSEQELDRISAALEAKRVPIAFDATMPGVARAVYADARRTLGHYLEYVYLRPESRRSYYAEVPHNS
jgi:hypothetical protein